MAVVRSRLRPVHQVFLTALLVGIGTYITGVMGHRTGLNVIWMFGIPVGVAVLGNSDAGSRAMMALVLIMCSLASVALTGEAFAFGP